MEKMKMRDQVVMKCKNAAIEQLGEVSSHARYPELLKGLIAQGLLRLMEPKVNIQCRAEDIKLVNAALAPAVALYVKTMKDRFVFSRSSSIGNNQLFSNPFFCFQRQHGCQGRHHHL
jgi:V-type H+-transporting ATPase subunit E